ncbi:C40 family peptidase [Fusibacillus kribbianus]|uniref:C40 family peptidase n=1 Tax=Fusibacillus kribbianus TaxID=3044208 RepID=A0AAP4BBD3_9FIRM|nr:C40 family peptidase [Ruminococcus sp. YH-rum2234]MDI9242535.1 C40 family peptidase [Ruminococcus sp. YH-rum2234]
MRKNRIAVTVGCMCASVLIAGMPIANAANKIEIDSAVAGLSVAMNNFYAGSENPENELKDYLQSTPTVQAAAPAPEVSPYENIAVSRVGDDEGYVNIRTDASTEAEVVGKIYNNCAATIEETVSREDGDWYKIKSGTVEGYIKSDFFVTGDEAEKVAMEIGKSFAEVSEGGLRLREEPNTESEVIDTLWQGDIYTVVDQQDGFVKLSLGKDDDGNDVVGYASKEYVNTYVKFDEAISREEEQKMLEEKARLEEEARKAEEELKKAEEEEKRKETEAAKKEETEATKKEETSASREETTSAPTKEETEAPRQEKPEAPTEAVSNATRSAVVAYAKQFIGNPYVYGGNSLTNGTDCSGFTRGVYSHFGIGLPRTSRSQAGAGTRVSIGNIQPGDLVFYARGGSIYHVAIYIGGGQIIHAIDEAHGIGISGLGSPYCAISLL